MHPYYQTPQSTHWSLLVFILLCTIQYILPNASASASPLFHRHHAHAEQVQERAIPTSPPNPLGLTSSTTSLSFSQPNNVGQYTIRKGIILGSNLQMGLVEMQYDQPLHIKRGLGSCVDDDNSMLTVSHHRARYTDYLSKQRMVVTAANNATLTYNLRYTYNCPDCVYFDTDAFCIGFYSVDNATGTYCQCPSLPVACTIMKSNLPPLVPNVVSSFLNPQVSVSQTYLVTVRWEDLIPFSSGDSRAAVQLMYFNMTVDWGEPDFYVTRLELYNGTFLAKDENFGGGNILVCPHETLWGPGVFYVMVFSYDDITAATGEGTSYHLHLTTTSPYPPLNATATVVNASHNCDLALAQGLVSSTQTCLKDGVKYRWNKTELGEERFVFPLIPSLLPRCATHGYVTLYYEAPEGATVLVSTRGPISYDNYSQSLSTTQNWEMTKNVISVECGGSSDGGGGGNGGSGGAVLVHFTNKRRVGVTYLLVDTSDAWIELVPTSRFTPFDYGFEILSTSALRCPSPDGAGARGVGAVGGGVDFSCNRRATAGPTLTEDCFRYWPALHHNNAFYPRPPWTFGSSTWQQVSSPNLIAEVEAFESDQYLYLFAVLMELSVDSVLITTDTNKEYLSPQQLSGCEIEFTGKLAFADGRPVSLPGHTVPIRERLSAMSLCDRVLVDHSVATLSSYIVAMDSTYDSADLRNLQYGQDIITFSDPWFNCVSIVNNILTRTDSMSYRTAVSDSCVVYSQGDPCCNKTLQWYTACRPREVQLSSQVYVPTSEMENLGGKEGSECTGEVVMEFVELYNMVHDPIIGCDVIQFSKTQFYQDMWRPYVQCREQWLGKDYQMQGIRCNHDDDCEPPALCARYPPELDPLRDLGDIDFGYCVLDYRVERTVGFLNCLYENMDTFVMTAVSKWFSLYSTTSTSTSTPSSGLSTGEVLYRVLANKYGCIDDRGGSLAIDRAERWLYVKTGTSEMCTDYFCQSYTCIDQLCKVPFRCDAGKNCWRGWSLVSESNFNSSCPDVIGGPGSGGVPGVRTECNWRRCNTTVDSNNVILTYGCEATCAAYPLGMDYFCGYCEESLDPDGTQRPQRCVEVNGPTNATECDSHVFCRLYNGTEYLASSAAECKSVLSPRHTRYGCSNEYFFDYPTQTDLRCIFKTPTPFVFWGSCTGRATITNSGGINFILTTVEGCIDTNSTCDPNTAPVVRRPTDAAECISTHACRMPYYDVRLVNGEIYTNQLPDDCAFSGGTYESTYTWLPSTALRGGQPRTLRWMKRTSFQSYVPGNLTDFQSLYNAIQDGIDQKYAFQIRSYGRCAFSGTTRLVMAIAACLESPPTLCSQRSTASTEDVVAVGYVCGGSGTEMRAPGLSIYISDSAVRLGGCESVSASIIPKNRFGVTKMGRLSSFSLTSTIGSGEYDFFNQFNAYVGVVIGFGFSLTFDEGKVDTNNTLVCISLAKDEDYGNFIYDLAVAEDTQLQKYQPLSIDSFLDPTTGKTCFRFVNLPIRIHTAYVPVLHSPTWTTDERRIFSSSEVVVFSLVAIAFLCNIIFAMYKYIPIVRYMREQATTLAARKAVLIDRISMSLIILSLFSLDRFVVFVLGASQISEEDISPAVGYLLSELPSYLFFSVATTFALTWMYITKQGRKLGLAKLKVDKIFFRVSVVINALLYIMFVVVVLLFEFLPLPPETVCLGHVVYGSVGVVSGGTTDREQRRRIVQMVYRLILSTISIVLAVFLTIYGGRMFYLTKDMGKSTSRSRRKQRARLFVTMVVCSLGLLVQAFYLAVKAIMATTRENTSTVVVFVVVTEIIPIFVMILVIKTTKFAVSDQTPPNTSSERNSVSLPKNAAEALKTNEMGLEKNIRQSTEE